MPFTVLIPARLASTRLPRKPLADLGGQPMIVRVVRQAARSGADRVVVATDSEEIARVVHAAGHEAVMTSAHHETGTDRLAEAAALLGLAGADIVVNVQGDEPEMPPSLIDAVARQLALDDGAAMSTAAHPMHAAEDWLNPNVVKVVCDARGRALYFSRAPIPWNRDAPPYPWPAGSGGIVVPATPASDRDPQAAAGASPLRHVGIYGYRVHFLNRFARLAPSPLEALERLEQLRALHHGEPITVHVVRQAPPAGIDTEADLAAARSRLAGDRPAPA